MLSITTNLESQFNPDPQADLLLSYFCKTYELYRAKKTELQDLCQTAGKSMSEHRFRTKIAKAWLQNTQDQLQTIIAEHFPDLKVEGRTSSIDTTEKKKLRASRILSAMKKMEENNHRQVLDSLGCGLVTNKFTLEYQDETTGAIKKLKTKHKDCQHFAFYKVQEREFTFEIFSNSDKKQYFFGTSAVDLIIRKLKSHNYKIARTPEKGDVICYFNDKRQITHFGVFKDSNTILSKHGDIKSIISHPLTLVPEWCSRNYMIFRKEGAADLMDTPWTMSDMLIDLITNNQ